MPNLNHLLFRANANRKLFLEGFESFKTKAGELGIDLSPYELDEADLAIFDAETLELVKEDLPFSFYFTLRFELEKAFLNGEPNGDDVKLNSALSLCPFAPSNEYEVFLAHIFKAFFRLLVVNLGCYKSRFQIQVEPEQHKTVFQGSSDDLRESYQLEIRPDDEPHLFVNWLSNPGAEVVSGKDVSSWTSAMFKQAGMQISNELPIMYDEKRDALILRTPSGERALIRNSLVNGRLLPTKEATDEGFNDVSDQALNEAVNLAMRLHSPEDVIERFGRPDFELPSVNWNVRYPRLGCPIVRQLCYGGISSEFFYLFRMWKSGVITLMLLGREK